jgi:hypothetical protein
MSEVIKKNLKEEKILHIIKCLDSWISKPTSVYLPDFFTEHAIPHKMFYGLVKREPRMNNYYYYVKNVLASRNHHILCTKKKISRYEAEKCAFLMKRYDPDMAESAKIDSMEDLGDYEKSSERNLKENLPDKIRQIYEDNLERKRIALRQESDDSAKEET